MKLDEIGVNIAKHLSLKQKLKIFILTQDKKTIHDIILSYIDELKDIESDAFEALKIFCILKEKRRYRRKLSKNSIVLINEYKRRCPVT